MYLGPFRLAKLNCTRPFSENCVMNVKKHDCLFLLLLQVIQTPGFTRTINTAVCPVSNSMISSIVEVIGASNRSLIHRHQLASIILSVNESVGANSSDIDWLNSFSYASSLAHDFRSGGNGDYASLADAYMSELMLVELRSLWMLFEGGVEGAKGAIARFLNTAALFTSMEVIASEKGFEKDTDRLLNETLAYLGSREEEIRSLPLSVFRRGSRLLHIGAGSGYLIRWMRITGWFAQVDGVDQRRAARQASGGLVKEWNGEISGYDVVVVSDNTRYERFKGKVEVVAREVMGGFEEDMDKSAILRRYLSENSVYYYLT